MMNITLSRRVLKFFDKFSYSHLNGLGTLHLSKTPNVKGLEER